MGLHVQLCSSLHKHVSDVAAMPVLCAKCLPGCIPDGEQLLSCLIACGCCPAAGAVDTSP